MQLHLIGGFLGSGKTTAIASAAKMLMQQGKRVGVITNDQGKYLVDTAFFRLADVPAVEVTGGCFCCNYDDLEARLTELNEQAQPDVIFAESVGSCADVVATVVKPLITLKNGLNAPASLSVFTDIRLLRQFLLGQPLPFSENVIYIFEQQIAEAGLLIVNKVDLLPEEHIAETQQLAQERWPDKTIKLQNTLDENSVVAWLDLLNSGHLSLPATSIKMDYNRYGLGEAALAWLDEAMTLTVKAGTGRMVTITAISAIVEALQTEGYPVGHVKFFVDDGEQQAKISFPTLATEGWEKQIPALSSTTINLLINARVQATADDLSAAVQQAVNTTLHHHGIVYQSTAVDVFHPGKPEPTHRMV